MSSIDAETKLEVTEELRVTSPGILNVSNLAGTTVSNPLAGTTSLFYDTDTDLVSYRNTITNSVVAMSPFDRRFGYFNNGFSLAVEDVEVEVKWNTLAIARGSVVSLDVNNRISLDSLGLYDININACYTGANTSRTLFRTRLAYNDGTGSTVLLFSEAYHYARNTDASRDTGSINIVYDNLVVGTTIRVGAVRMSGNMSGLALSTAFRAVVTKISI